MTIILPIMRIAPQIDIVVPVYNETGARVEGRGLKREITSRAYNLLLRAYSGARFSDAQCGFKAARRDAVSLLMPMIEDDSWFFDTELLLLAQHHGLRLHEVPVHWV